MGLLQGAAIQILSTNTDIVMRKRSVLLSIGTDVVHSKWPPVLVYIFVSARGQMHCNSLYYVGRHTGQSCSDS